MIEEKVIFKGKNSILHLVRDKNGKYVVRKQINGCKECPISVIEASWENYQKVKDIPGVVKWFSFFSSANSAVAYLEYIENTESIYQSKRSKPELMTGVMEIIAKMCDRGYMNLDFDLLNFVVDRSGKVWMLDLDQIVKFELANESRRYWFAVRMEKLLKWYAK